MPVIGWYRLWRAENRDRKYHVVKQGGVVIGPFQARRHLGVFGVLADTDEVFKERRLITPAAPPIQMTNRQSTKQAPISKLE